MRVIKEFNLGHLKCSLFVNQERHTLKIEDEFGEVSYKLGRLDVDPTQDIDSYIELPEVKNSIIEAFRSMRKGRDKVLSLMTKPIEESFDEII